MELCLFIRLWPFFVISMFATLSSRPMVTHASFKKIIASFFIGVLIFLVSSNKSNDLLIFTIASSYHGNKSYRNTSDKIETGNGFDCSNSLLRVCFLLNYNLVPYDKSPASPSPGTI
jgi:hypothetical protein